jgi:hypothetical protein
LRGVEISRDGDDSVVNGCSYVSFRSFLHLEEDHRGDFFRWLEMEKVNTIRNWKKDTTNKFFLLPFIFNTGIDFASLAEDLEREVLEIRLNFCIVVTNKTFSSKILEFRY